ncbi:glycosyltransferase [Candidatus Nitrospira nitrificans]|uniref:glycosyltransferase n=1 Tax=Candidatus Nitrospira nitrificans TaxID=1742973 RepID=UPI001584E0E2|nr:glycosyltransferase [Candidatus Nitrospira nitrificans]
MKPIRVCHLASGDLWAGAEVQIATLLRALKADQRFDLSAIVLNKGRLAEELAAAGISVMVYDESAGAWSTLRSLVSHLRRHRPDIVHSHRYKEHILGAFAAKLSHNSLVVQTYHGLDEHLHGWAAVKMRAYTTLNTIVGKVAGHGFVGVSEEISAILRCRYTTGKVSCIRNGVDLTRVKTTSSGAHLRKQLGISSSEFVIGSVGRLTPVKGLEYLIRAVSKNKGPRERKLLIVGDGPLRPALEGLAREVGVAGRVLFLGARNDVYDLMGVFDVLALPSLHEGVPMVLLEAMAMAVPIIASRVGGIPEILDDEQGALLVQARDVDVLADAIETMANDEVLRNRLRKAARARVESRFSIERTAALTGDLYCELMGNSRVPA